jgi:molybdopterin-guanine dinucleotide biosynthesis protein A
MQFGPVAGLVLAGGRSSRMGGGNKALEVLAGRTLLQRVVDRITPQVDEVALSVEKPSAAFAVFGLAQLPDPAPGHNGPLAGLLSGLRYFQAQQGWVLLAPCDAPFLPPDLAARLREQSNAAATASAVVSHEGQLQPTFSIWHHSLLPRVEHAVEREGMTGLKEFLRMIDFAVVDWSDASRPACMPPFFNINDAEALGEAERWILTGRRAKSPCSA